MASTEYHAGDGLVERTVAANGDDNVELSRVKPGIFCCVATLAGRENAYDIIVCGEDSDNIRQKAQRNASAGNRVYDEHHAL